MEKKRYPILEEEDHAGMACEPSVGTTAAFSTYDAGSAPYDDDIASDEDLDDIDWDRLPSLGPFSEEEAKESEEKAIAANNKLNALEDSVSVKQQEVERLFASKEYAQKELERITKEKEEAAASKEVLEKEAKELAEAVGDPKESVAIKG